MTNKLGILLLAILASVSLLVTLSQDAIASNGIMQEAADLDVAEAENATSTGSGTNQTASGTNSTG